MSTFKDTEALCTISLSEIIALTLAIKDKVLEIPKEDRDFALRTIKISLHLAGGSLDRTRENLLESGESQPMNEQQKEAMNKMIAELRQTAERVEMKRALRKMAGTSPADMKN